MASTVDILPSDSFLSCFSLPSSGKDCWLAYSNSLEQRYPQMYQSPGNSRGFKRRPTQQVLLGPRGGGTELLLKHMRSVIALGLAIFCSSGCQRTPEALLELQYALTPEQLPGPAIGTDLPLYAWHYTLPKNSPDAKYDIRMELRRDGSAPYTVCELTAEYLSSRPGRDLVISVKRPGTNKEDAVKDTQFQIRLLDAQGEATAIVANNNNCGEGPERRILNSPFVFSSSSKTEPSARNERKLWQIRDQNGQILGKVVLVAERQ